MLKIDRYGDLTPEARARMAEGLHELARSIAEEHGLSFADAPSAHPGPEDIARSSTA